MTKSELLQKDCDDLRGRIDSARRATPQCDASDRDRSDLLMMEQELIGLEQKLAHTDDSKTDKPHAGKSLPTVKVIEKREA